MKKLNSIILTLCILCGVFSASIMTSFAIQTKPTINDGKCVIKIESSGKTVNNNAGINKNNNKVVAWSFDGTTDQHWIIQYIGNGKYIFKTINGKVLDLYHGGSNKFTNGMPVDIWDYNDPKFQEFYINPIGNGLYTIEIAAFPGNVLTCNSASTNGGRFTAEKNANKSSQKFYFCNTQGTKIDPTFVELPVVFDVTWPAPSAYQVTVLSYYYGKASSGSHPTKGSGSILGAMDIGGSGDVVSIESGTVVAIVKGYGGGWGNNITIRHDNGQFSFYAHLKNNSIAVSLNSKVKKGQKIGVIGSTGNSTGNHLHFEIWDKNKATTETWVCFRDKYKSKIRYDADIVSGGSNPLAWRNWIKSNCVLSGGSYIGKK